MDELLKILNAQNEENERHFGLKKLKKHRSFLIYLVCLYPDLVSYLKGLHLVLESWCPDRYKEGRRKKLEKKGVFE